ncbi:MAG: PDZ domain-containing protein [Nitrospira sp.]
MKQVIHGHSAVIGVGLLALLAGIPNLASASPQDSAGELKRMHRDEAAMPPGVIGVSLQVGAERIGDPAILYVAMVHPEGPAYRAGLAHGDEVVSVDGIPVAGKTYEEVVKMIRGAVGTVVKVSVKGEGGVREVAITRVAGDQLPKGPTGAHGGGSK